MANNFINKKVDLTTTDLTFYIQCLVSKDAIVKSY